MGQTEPRYWYEVRHPTFGGSRARMPIRQTKRGDRCPDGQAHHKGCGCQVLVNGRKVERGTNCMRWAE